MKTAKETRQAQMSELVRTMELQPVMIDTAKKVLGDDATEEEMRDFWADSLKNIPGDMLFSDGCMYVSNMDYMFAWKVIVLRSDPYLKPLARVSD